MQPVRVGTGRPDHGDPELGGRFIVGGGQERQDLADGTSPAVGFVERQLGSDLVVVAAAVLVFDDVPSFGEVSDDAIGGAFGDARPGRDVAQSHARVVGDAQQHPGVAAQEAPVRRIRRYCRLFPEIYC